MLTWLHQCSRYSPVSDPQHIVFDSPAFLYSLFPSEPRLSRISLSVKPECSVLWSIWVVVDQSIRKIMFSISVFITFLDYFKIPQVAILGDLHV
jgi:hypothetical protein